MMSSNNKFSLMLRSVEAKVEFKTHLESEALADMKHKDERFIYTRQKRLK
jgi:hypothetical protein